MRIAVLRALQLGDLLVAVPALRALRRTYPDAHITLVALPWAASFVARFARYVDALEEYAAGSSGLQNLGDGYYQWNWKTPRTYAGSCKTLLLTLDGAFDVTQVALFRFTR